jgi:hypothetical protein
MRKRAASLISSGVPNIPCDFISPKLHAVEQACFHIVDLSVPVDMKALDEIDSLLRNLYVLAIFSKASAWHAFVAQARHLRSTLVACASPVQAADFIAASVHAKYNPPTSEPFALQRVAILQSAGVNIREANQLLSHFRKHAFQ